MCWFCLVRYCVAGDRSRTMCYLYDSGTCCDGGLACMHCACVAARSSLAGRALNLLLPKANETRAIGTWKERTERDHGRGGSIAS